MSHQDRRAPLPAEYQYPTHGVDCDCPTCRNKWVHAPHPSWAATITLREPPQLTTQTAYGWGV